MNGPASVALPNLTPGATGEVSVDLVVPNTPGLIRSTWKPRNPQNNFFSFEQYAEIRIGAPVPVGTSEARYVDDVTITDGTVMKPGQAFRKTWRIRNSGQTEWGTGYTLAFFSGDKMGAADSVPLPLTKVGQETNVSVDLIAPNTPGLIRSTWKPRDPQNKFFEFEQYAEIMVVPPAQVDDAAFVADVIVLKPGQTFVKTWRVRNSGQTRWVDGYVLAFVSGDALGTPPTVPIPQAKPNELVDVSVTLTAPSAAGIYNSQWRLRSPGGTLFGATLTAQIEVRV
jgi:hypothetical protein